MKENKVIIYTANDGKEMSWQKVGTSYTPGSNGSDYKHFKRK